MAPRIEKYTALVIQPHVIVAEDRGGIRQNLERVCNLIDFGVGYFWELPARLVVLPEYFLQGVTPPAGRTAEEMPDLHEHRIRRAQAIGALRKS